MFCGRTECPNCKRIGDCALETCIHPEIKNSKTLYFPTYIGNKFFSSWDELQNYIIYRE